MGSCLSQRRTFVPDNNISGQEELCLPIFEMLGFTTKDINSLYNAFCDIDFHHVGSITPIELFTYLSVELGPFEQALFSVFDEDKSGKLTFLEFVCSMWNLLSMPTQIIGALCYLIKDPTGQMRVHYSDMREVMEMMHRKKVESSSSLQSIMSDLRNNYGSELSINEICKWSSQNHTIMSPLVIMQLKFRKFLLGEKYWAKVTDDRAGDAELGSVEYIRKFFNLVRKKSEEARNLRKEMARQASVKGQNLTESQKNIKRKQSILLGSFNMKQTAPARTNATANEEDLKMSLSEKRKKKQPSFSASADVPGSPTVPMATAGSFKQRQNGTGASPSPSLQRQTSSKVRGASSKRGEALVNVEEPPSPGGGLSHKASTKKSEDFSSGPSSKNRPKSGVGSSTSTKKNTAVDEHQDSPVGKMARKPSAKSQKLKSG